MLSKILFAFSVLISSYGMSLNTPNCLLNHEEDYPRLESSGYRIVSDVYDAKIPAGHYILCGKVIDYEGGFVLEGAEFTTTNDSKLTPKGTKGEFSVRLKLSQNYVRCNKTGYKESVFEEYEIKDRHRIKVEFVLISNTYKEEYNVKKPVVYLYSVRDLDVQLNLNPTGNLSFFYPAFDQSTQWNVHLSPSGQIQNRAGKNFPYLFWESNNTNPISLKKEGEQILGSVVRKDQILAFLESSLDEMGLNSNEKTDFITFWGPQLLGKEYAFIQFLSAEDCNQFATYDISPKPDHLQRIYMVYTLYDTKPTELNCQKQTFNSQNRSGFFMLEWGGMELPFDRLIHI